MVQWQSSTSDVWEDAKSNSKPIVLFFVEKDDEATRDGIRGPKVSPLSKEKANFVLVVRPAKIEEAAPEKVKGPAITGKKGDGEAKVEDADTATSSKQIVPVSKLLAVDLWKAYGVTAANSVVVADWFGNEKAKFVRVPSENNLIKTIDGVTPAVERDAKALASDLEKLEQYVSKNEDPKAVKQAVKIFKRGLAGHDSIAKTEEHYKKLMENGRAKIRELETAGDAVALRALRGTYRETDLEDEVGKAVTRVVAATKS